MSTYECAPVTTKSILAKRFIEISNSILILVSSYLVRKLQNIRCKTAETRRPGLSPMNVKTYKLVVFPPLGDQFGNAKNPVALRGNIFVSMFDILWTNLYCHSSWRHWYFTETITTSLVIRDWIFTICGKMECFVSAYQISRLNSDDSHVTDLISFGRKINFCHKISSFFISPHLRWQCFLFDAFVLLLFCAGSFGAISSTFIFSLALSLLLPNG